MKIIIEYTHNTIVQMYSKYNCTVVYNINVIYDSINRNIIKNNNKNQGTTLSELFATRFSLVLK